MAILQINRKRGTIQKIYPCNSDLRFHCYKHHSACDEGPIICLDSCLIMIIFCVIVKALFCFIFFLFGLFNFACFFCFLIKKRRKKQWLVVWIVVCFLFWCIRFGGDVSLWLWFVTNHFLFVCFMIGWVFECHWVCEGCSCLLESI